MSSGGWNKAYILLCVVCLCLIIPVILQYSLRWDFLKINTNTVSIYGIYLFIYIFFQMIFASINNIRYSRVNKNDFSEGFVNLIVVGYREDVKYYKMCLDSIKNSLRNLNKIYVIIDGNSKEDMYMVDIFNEVFKDRSIHINLLNKENTDTHLICNYMNKINDNQIICITQPHGGKRHAMYTGFQLSLIENNLYNRKIKAIMCTDSDTTIEEDSVNELFRLFNNENIGAVAGNLSIYNKYDSVVSFLSSVRYWYAFNLERAYQSFNKCVSCVSGPIGMYKLRSIERVLDEWRDQTFLNQKCTYGDDRHLTNKILSLCENVIYTPIAKAETETPSNMYRFYKQQVRWSKSAFREFFWNIKLINEHSIFMTIDLVYILVYPYIVMGYLMYVLWYGSIVDLGLYCCVLLILGIIKSIYGWIMSKNIENMFYVLYVVSYLTIVFPAKIWALINLNDNSWGTSSRKILNNDFSIDIIVPIVWNITIISGLCFNITQSILRETSIFDYIYIIIASSFWILIFNVMLIYVYIKRENQKKEN